MLFFSQYTWLILQCMVCSLKQRHYNWNFYLQVKSTITYWNKCYVTLCLELHPLNFMSWILSWMDMSFQNLTNLEKRYYYSNDHKWVYKYVFSSNLILTFFPSALFTHLKNLLKFGLLNKVEFVGYCEWCFASIRKVICYILERQLLLKLRHYS